MRPRLLWALVVGAGLVVVVWAAVAGSGGDAELAGDDYRGAASTSTLAVAAGATVTSAATVTGAGASATTNTVVGAGTGTTGSVPVPTVPSAASTTTASTPVRRVAEGTWGGAGIRLVVTGTGALVEYDCASGLVAEALVVDAGGSFAATGTHAFQSGGPSQGRTPAPPGQPARYSGSVNGSQMTLNVVLPDAGRTLGPFTLDLGAPPLLERCG